MNPFSPLVAFQRGALAAVLVLLGACGGGGDSQEDDRAGPASTTEAETECGSASFPCTLDKVALAVLERGDLLADQVVVMLKRGDKMSAVLGFVTAQAGVADAAANASGLRFRLVGGRDVFILLAAPRPAGAVVAATPVATSASSDPAREAPRMKAQFVVGETPTVKRALVLSPFKYYFAPDDDGAAVAAILDDSRGYGGNVTYMENMAKTSATVGIQQFVGWEAFDVIHVTSHGGRICGPERCVSAILTGDIYSSARDLLRLTEEGINTARMVENGEKYLALGPQFFKKHYPAGLERKIIFFNACQTFGTAGDGLSDVLLGAKSVFLGWSEVVQNDAASKAAQAFFQRLSTTGVTVDAALDAIGGLAINRYLDAGKEVAAALLVDRDVASDLRLREVVTLERPKAGGELLADMIVSVEGKAQDGVVDNVPYKILVEGIPANQQDLAIVQFTVNGRSSTPQAVTIGERVGDTGWRLTGSIPYIDVPPEQVVDMIATVTLPEGGRSEHRVRVRLAAEPPPAAETWIGESVSHFDDSTPQGQVHITRIATVIFKQTSASVGARYKVMRSVSGTLKWTRSGTIVTPFDGVCAYSTPTIEVPIQEGDGEITIDAAALPSPFAFSGLTTGTTVQVAEVCGNYAFSTRAGGGWGPAVGLSEGFRTSADGATVAGSASMNLSTWTWTFRRQ